MAGAGTGRAWLPIPLRSCSILKDNNRFNAIYQTTTRDKNRYQLQKDLALAHETGVDNLLVFTEDYRITGDSPCRNPCFSMWIQVNLASVLDHLKNGVTIEGKEMGSKAMEFTCGLGR